MEINRRSFLRTLALGVVGSTIDVDRLLWVPGQKKIFIPSNPSRYIITHADLVAVEMERVLPKIITLFERDNIFYSEMIKKNSPRISTRLMRIPLTIGQME